MTMEDRVLTNLAKPRLYAVVLGGFGFAVVIAGVGLFGVLVVQRGPARAGNWRPHRARRAAVDIVSWYCVKRRRAIAGAVSDWR